MKKIEEVYRESFFARRHKLAWRAPIVCNAIINTFDLKPNDDIIDVGCAIGEYVSYFRDLGFIALGLEGSNTAFKYKLTDNIIIFDIRTSIKFDFVLYKYDLCMSLEVAEHIEEEYADVYIENLCELSDKVLITAAPPDSKGHSHVNCQPKEYWQEKFFKNNFARNIEKEAKFQSILARYNRKKGICGYIKNVMIFEHKESEK